MSRFLDALTCAPQASVEEWLGNRPLVVLAPHPDDETLGCGALLFAAASRGTECRVVCVTDGSRSHPKSRKWPARRLVQERRTELGRAVAILAPQARIDWLGHPDCAVPVNADTTREISGLVPDHALVMASWDGDPHIDHERVALLARHVAAERPDITLAFYPIWGRFGKRTASARLIRASAAARTAKAAALACYRTQMSALIDDDDSGFVMEDWRQAHFLTHPEIVIAP